MKAGKGKFEKVIKLYWLHECNDQITRIPLVEYRVFIFMKKDLSYQDLIPQVVHPVLIYLYVDLLGWELRIGQ